MKKRVLSLFLVFVLCLTLLPTSVFAEGEDVSISGGVIGGGETGGEGGGIYVAPGSPTEGGGGTYIPGEDTRTEIWCVSKPDSIGRSYDGTTDGGTIPIDLTFTDGTNEIKLKEGTGFTAKKTFDSADAGWHTVTVEIELIGEAAVKYKLKAGEETFTIGGNINKAYPDLTVTLSKTACTAGEKLLPLLSVEGAPKDAEVTYYYLASALKSWAGSSDVEGSDAMPKIDENTAISDPGTYYVYAKTGETKNYEEERSTTAELTVNEAVVEAASVTKADGTDGGTYDSLPAALNAAQDGDTVKLLADHVTDADALNALGENFTFAQYASIVPVVTKTLTLDLNHKTVDYLEVGFTETNEETQKKETLATGNLTVTGEAAYGRISNLMFMAGALDIRSGEIGGSGCEGLLCDANSGSVTVSNGTVYGLTVLEGASVTVNGGSKHAGEWVVASGATLNITDGTFGEVQFTRNGTIAISGGTFQSIKSYIAEELQPLMSLLDTQKVHAFYKGDDVQDGNATELADVTVKEHTHTMVNNKCACGFSCAHTNAEGASTIGADGKCTVCGTQFAAGIGETYYTDVKSALNAAADGQTVKLLANEMLPGGIYASKTLTLDLNGHSLDGYSLNVGGLTATSQVRTGKLTVIDSSGGNGAVGVTVRDGGTLVFDPENDHTTLLQLEVWGGTVELYGGKISRSGLRLNNNITLGNLLPRQAGLAYYRDDTQLTPEEAASQTCDLVVKSCSHGGKNGFDNNSTACPYCNAPAVAETALNHGEERRFADLQTALDADRNGGAELTLLTDVTGDYTIDGTQDTGLNLNGHSIKGTVTVKAAAGSNTTTLSNTKNITTASIDAVVAYRGAKLAGSKYPAVIGELTLAEGATWENILNLKTLGYKVLNGDGTYQWYAPDDVNGSQLNNVIINSLPITTKTLNLKVDGKNLTGNSPKVERGTTVQLCASCNAKDADVTFSILKTGETTPITLSGNDVKYTTVGTGKTKFYVAEYIFNDVGSYTISFTAAKDGYTVQSSEKTLTVTKPNLSNAEITFPDGNETAFNYATATGVPTFIVTYNGNTLEKDVDFTIAGGDSTYAVGPCTLTITAVGNGDYTGSKSAQWNVRPLKIAASVGDIIKTYDGTTDLPANAKITFKSADSYYAGVPLSLAKGTDYEVLDARYDSADASQEEKTISFTVKLKNKGYVFEDGTTQKDFTLNGAELDDKSFKINQATVTPAEITLFVYNDVAKTYTLNLATLLPELTSGCEYGKIKYQGCDYHFTDSTYLDSNNGMFVSNDGILTLPIVAAHSADVNKQIGTITAPVVTANYQQFELAIKVVIGEKITPVKSDDFKISATGITYRQTLENSTLTVEGTMKDPTTGKEVPGTFAWKNEYDLPIQTGDVYFDWTFTPAEGYEEYAAVTDIVKVPVAPKSINGATITLEKYEFAYNAAEQSPKITGVTLENWDETRITYVIKSGDKATDVSDRITLTIEGTGNYTGTATVEWKITPKTVTPTIEVEPCTYTGDALEPTVTVKDDIGNIIDQKEYEIFYSNNTNAGIATVTIKDVEGGNYVLSGASKTFEITKAAAPTMQPIELTVINGLAKTYLVNLPALPTLGDNCKYGSIKYEACNFDLIGEGGYANSTAMITSNDEFQLTVPAVESQTEGSVGTVGVKITTDNYQDMILTVEVIAKNKIVPVLDGEITATPITFGQILRVSTITGTMKDDGKTVEGTFEWTNPSTKPDKAGDYQAEWTFTPAKGYEEYATVTGTVTIKVNKATPTFTAPTAQENLTYTGQEQALITAGSVMDYGTMQYSLTENGTYSQDIPAGTDAGAYTVWYRVIGDANHNDTAPASVAVRIGQKPLTITGVTAASKPYDGTTDAGITSVTFDGVNLNRGTDYTVTANFDDASVDSGKNITATVILMEQAAKNYVLEQSSFPTTGSIIKAAAPDFTKETALTIVNGHEKTYTVTLPALPTLETPKAYGALTYEIGEIKLNDGYYTSGAKVENGELTLPIQKNDVETTGSVGTVTVVIKSANYEDITLTVNVSAKNKLSPVLAGTLTLTPIKITYGEPLSKIKITGTMKAGDTVVEGTFSWQLPSDTILDASTSGHDVGWTFTPKDGDTYTEVTGTVKVPVAPKSIEGATITLEKYEFQYNAAEQSPRITGVTLEDWSETRITYVIKSGDKATDANDSITLTIEGTGNYTGKATVEWKITPREVTPTIEVASCTYTGDALEPTVTLKDGAVVIPEGEYTVEYSNNTNAGTGWVAIKDVEGGNYIITSIRRDFPIDQAAAPTNIQHGTLSVINGTHLTYTYDFQQLLPEASNGDYGTVHYDLGNRQTAINFTAHGYYIDPEIVEFEGSKLTLVGLYAKDGTATGQIGTVKVNVTTTNYADFKLTLVLNAVNQIKPTPDGEITAAEITYGDALSKSTISGKMKDPDTGQSVNGTFAWTDGTINPNAGDYEAEWTFTPAAGYEKYATATGTVTIKVNKAAPTFTAPTAKTLTYNRMAQTLLTAGSTQSGTIKYRLGDSGAFVDSIPTGKDAGTYTVYYKVVGDENHNDTAEQSITVTIDPMKLSRFVLGIDSLTKAYDGTASASLDKNEIEFRSNGATVLLSEDAYDITNARFTVRADGSYQDSPEAGDGKSLSFTVTLKNDNYVFGGDEESKTLDCNIVAEDAKSFTIAKATAPAAETGSLTITNGLRTTCSLDLSTLLPKLTAPCNYGMITYDKKVVTDLGVGAFITLVDGKTGELTLEANRSGTDEGQFGTITVTVSTSNYQDITLTINVIAKNRITPTGTPTLSKNTITYGDALNTIALSGKLHDNVNNVDVDGTFEWVDGTHIPVIGNGTYAAEWIFEPTDTERYLTVSGRSNITVEKAQQYGKVSMAGYTYGQAPSTPTLTDRTGDANAQVTYCYSTAGSGSVQTWDIQNPPALNAGTYRMYASIGDTDNYYGFEAVYCEFVVAKAMPTYTAPTGLTAKYGQTLADVTLPDGWSWMDSSESVGGASTAAKTFQAKFTPTDAVNYNTVENIKLDVTVNKANGGLKTVELTQKYTDTSEHTYTPDWSGLPTGQTWSYSSEYSVNTGSNVTLTKQDFAADGSLLTYAISGGKAGDKITLTLKASCDNYEDFTITLNVTLTEKDDQKPLTITGAGSVVYGQTLTLTTTGGSGLGTVTYRIDTDASTGEATIDPETGVLTPVKVGSVSVIATKAGDNDYNDVTSAPFVLMIKPATLTGEVELYHKSSSGGGWYDSCYTIKATAGAGGSISPSGSVSVREGRDQTFTITPDKGYAVSNVKIDGKSIGAVKSYTFENVSRPHTIEVIFMKANGNPQTGVFVDVATGSYYEDAVDWAVENGITKGTTNTTFSPDADCTRAQIVTFLWRCKK